MNQFSWAEEAIDFIESVWNEQIKKYDFYKEGVHIIGAGGKNQVVKLYYELSEQLKIPIFVLMDRDAQENIQQIMPRLRSIDKVHLVSCGEFEDILPISLIIKTVNNMFENFIKISEDDFRQFFYDVSTCVENDGDFIQILKALGYK